MPVTAAVTPSSSRRPANATPKKPIVRRRRAAMVNRAAIMACLALASCGKPMPVERFAGTKPDFDPVTFWTGHTHSWGVVENRGGAPDDIIQTDCIGTPEGPDGLHMQQTLTEGDGTVKHRDWHLRRTGPDHFTATANDMVGQAQGIAAGRVFHWQWVWAIKPGNALFNVTMSQWMYAMPDGTMMNRTTISKLGVIVAEVSEQFSRAP
jgi:hypothetical protein